jgi:adenosylcobinamide-GDP ribazoletransferase
VLLKTASIAALDVATAMGALIAAHASARLATVAALASMPYAGDAEAAKVKPLATGTTQNELAVAAVIGLAPVLLIDPACFMLGLIGGAIPAVLLALQSNRLIGGYTGDVLGAIEQVFEIGFLLAVVAGGLHNH